MRMTQTTIPQRKTKQREVAAVAEMLGSRWSRAHQRFPSTVRSPQVMSCPRATRRRLTFWRHTDERLDARESERTSSVGGGILFRLVDRWSESGVPEFGSSSAIPGSRASGGVALLQRDRHHSRAIHPTANRSNPTAIFRWPCVDRGPNKTPSSSHDARSVPETSRSGPPFCSFFQQDVRVGATVASTAPTNTNTVRRSEGLSGSSAYELAKGIHRLSATSAAYESATMSRIGSNVCVRPRNMGGEH